MPRCATALTLFCALALAAPQLRARQFLPPDEFYALLNQDRAAADEGEKMGELAHEAEQQMLAAQFRQAIGSELRQAARRLGRSKARERGLEAGQRLIGGEPVDVHAAIRRLSGTPEASAQPVSGRTRTC